MKTPLNHGSHGFHRWILTLFLSVLSVLSVVNPADAWWVTNQFGTQGQTVTITFNTTPASRPLVLSNGVILYSQQVKATATNGILSPVWLDVGQWNCNFGPSFDPLLIREATFGSGL